MLEGVFVKSYPASDFDRKEILRYAGCKESGETLEKMLDECLKECENAFSYRVCYRVFEAEEFLGTYSGGSKALAKNLGGCAYAVAFGATVGLPIDRLIARYAGVSAARSLLFQAIGAERIESLCDAFCEDLKAQAGAQGWYTRPRFSPGYGDFPLQAQSELFRALDCARKIGLTLNGSLLMTPTKSVTAVVGLSKTLRECKTGCETCSKSTECEWRKR